MTLSDKDNPSKEMIAKKIRELIEQPIFIEGMPIVVTAGIGCATFPGDGNEVDDLIKAADSRMYEKKGSKKGKANKF